MSKGGASPNSKLSKQMENDIGGCLGALILLPFRIILALLKGKK